jgi:hypothetical protein
MIYDHRTAKIKLHASDKRFLAGAYSLLVGLAKVDPGSVPEGLLGGLQLINKTHGVKGDEHLTKPVKEEIKTK